MVWFDQCMLLVGYLDEWSMTCFVLIPSNLTTMILLFVDEINQMLKEDIRTREQDFVLWELALEIETCPKPSALTF